MKRLVLALAASAALAAPAAAQSMTLLLPSMIFPDGTVTPSTKGCADPATGTTCKLQE